MNPKAEVGQRIECGSLEYTVTYLGNVSGRNVAVATRLHDGEPGCWFMLDEDGRYKSPSASVVGQVPGTLRALVARFCEDVDAAVSEAEARALAASRPERRDDALNALEQWARDFRAALGENDNG
jgi:hypothetical protein